MHQRVTKQKQQAMGPDMEGQNDSRTGEKAGEANRSGVVTFSASSPALPSASCNTHMKNHRSPRERRRPGFRSQLSTGPRKAHWKSPSLWLWVKNRVTPNFDPHPNEHTQMVGQHPNRTPSKHPNPTTKIGSKLGGEFIYPRIGSHWFLPRDRSKKPRIKPENLSPWRLEYLITFKGIQLGITATLQGLIQIMGSCASWKDRSVGKNMGQSFEGKNPSWSTCKKQHAR